MMHQQDLFEPVAERVQPYGECLQDGFETVSMAGKKRWPFAEIQLAQDDDGRWMWAVSVSLSIGGSSYQVGRKWGQFADSRNEALCNGLLEVISKAKGLGALDTPQQRRERNQVIDWAKGYMQ